MPYVPLALPPGIVRPGTKYDARGRWYDASLVRWHEKAMQPVGGWQRLERTSQVAVDAALSFESGVGYTDETADANNATTDDVVLIPSPPSANDAFFIGYDFRFTEVDVNVSTAATDGAVTWEYWDGSAWVALSGVSDETGAFQTSGTNAASWDLPNDWEQTTVNSQGPYYYVRARVTTVGTTQALGEQIWIGTGPVDVDEPIRGMIAWRANDQSPQLGFGTATKAYVYAGGVLDDVTPAGFTTGGEDAVLSAGNYGNGAYGSGPYGTGDTAQSNLTEANTWQFDNFGEDLIACAYSDGKLYERDTSAGGVMTQISNSPTGCEAVVVTPERFVVGLATQGDGRQVEWSDQEASSTWTATATNQAGSFILPGPGQILAGRRGRNETLIWTDHALFAMRYIGGPLVYSFQELGSHCGAIGRLAMAVVDGRAIWMGPRGFFIYDGYVKPLTSDVGDYVFSDMNRLQSSKIAADVRSDFNEVIWYYPSSGSTENDRYVVFNYDDGTWTIGQLERTAGYDRGALSYPVAADASGVVWQHEIGEDYEDPSGDTLAPFAESGPIELGNGDRLMVVRELVPDEKTLGDVQAKIFSALYPNADETEHGPFTLTNPTDVRLTGRQVRLRVDHVRGGWRVGTPRLEVVPGSQR